MADNKKKILYSFDTVNKPIKESAEEDTTKTKRQPQKKQEKKQATKQPAKSVKKQDSKLPKFIKGGKKK